MAKISKIAVKTPCGKVVTAPIGKHHADIIGAGKGLGMGKMQRGFIKEPGTKFIGRPEATKVARASGQTKTKKPLHSHLLHKVK